MGKADFENHCKAIESAIIGQQIIIDHLNGCLEAANEMEDEEEAEMERDDIANDMAGLTKAVETFQRRRQGLEGRKEPDHWACHFVSTYQFRRW